MPKSAVTGPNIGTGQFSIKGSHSIVPSPPVKVGSQRQLLMDDHVVDDWWECRRTVHQPTKHPDNPLIRPTEPWEGTGPGNGTVLYDEQAGRFRLWGGVWDDKMRNPDGSKAARSLRGIYYESEDGVHWEAPELGILEWDGSTANNLILGGDRLHAAMSVFELPSRLSDRGRFGMLQGVAKPGRSMGHDHSMDQIVAYSDDGVRWTYQTENPVFHARSDTYNNIVYNRDRDVFMQYRRASVNANEIRRIAYSESEDLVSWTQPTVVVKPDELDPPMLYGMAVCRYQGVYLGTLQMLYFDAEARHPKSHQMDAELAWSRDGVEWSRHPERPIFLEGGLIGDYDWGMVYAWNDIIERPDGIYIYYDGHDALHTSAVPGSGVRSFSLATLRKDGFVSIDSVSGRVGYMLTRPLECSGGGLHINAKTGTGGYVKVAVRQGDGEMDGEWLPDWSFETNAVFTGDATDHVVGWTEGDSLDSLGGQSVRLHFWLHDAELYSFWFE